MSTTLDPKVQLFLHDLEMSDKDKFILVTQILEVVVSTYPDIQLQIKYGGIYFVIAEFNSGGIYAYKDHVSVEFSNGYLLEDTAAMLQGEGKFRRHIKLNSPKDIETTNLVYFLKQLKNLGVKKN